MAGSYIVQKAVEASKVKKGLLKPETEYEWQSKYDGCCAILKFGEGGDFIEALSRTGENAQSMWNVGLAMQNWEFSRSKIFHNVAVIGEAWWPGKGQFNQISGEFRRYKASGRLAFAINDVIPLDDFEAGQCLIPYKDRVINYRTLDEWEFFFVDGWRSNTDTSAQERCNVLVDEGGYDGLILRDPNGTWTVGRGTTGEIIKVKQKLSFDLRVLEVNTVLGEKTGRDVHKLVCDFRGNRLGVGSGVPHARADLPSVGDIVEVEAMDYSSDGLLREPRFKGIRFDKLEPDA